MGMMAEIWGDETRWCLACGNGDEKATCAECGGTGWHLTDAGRGLVRLLDALGVEREQTFVLNKEMSEKKNATQTKSGVFVMRTSTSIFTAKVPKK